MTSESAYPFARARGRGDASGFGEQWYLTIDASNAKLPGVRNPIALVCVRCPAGGCALGTNITKCMAAIWVSIVLGFSIPTLAQTVIGGVIDQDTVWTLTESPYIATETVEVIDGAVLTIEPGVEVAFEAGTSLNAELGVLIADGQGGDPIVLRSASGEIGGWHGVFTSLDEPAITTAEGEYVGGPIFRNVRIIEADIAV